MDEAGRTQRLVAHHSVPSLLELSCRSSPSLMSLMVDTSCAERSQDSAVLR
jgi:hypothetical protein